MFAKYLVLATDTPAAANEYGFSPDVFSLRPHLVFWSTTHVPNNIVIAITAYIIAVVSICPAHPIDRDKFPGSPMCACPKIR